MKSCIFLCTSYDNNFKNPPVFIVRQLSYHFKTFSPMLKVVIYMKNVQPGQALSRLDKIIFSLTKRKSLGQMLGQKVGQNKVGQ